MEIAPFYAPELSRAHITASQEARTSTLSLLESPEFIGEINDGNVTLAMIRPAVGPDANLLHLPDVEAAEAIEEMIEGLGVLCKFSFQFTHAAAENFYRGGPQESMSQEEAVDPKRYESRWPEFVDFMASGPTTALILHDPSGEAIPKWRSHLGHWNIDEVRDMETIRGKLGVNKYNNLVHGSDSPEAILTELEIIKSCLRSEPEQQIE